MSPSLDAENLEILRDFIAESRDILECLDPSLMKLEEAFENQMPLDEEIIHDIFRGFHSIKGAAGFLKLSQVIKLTHEAESLLDLIRKGMATLKTDHLERFYACGDLLKDLLTHIQATGGDTGLENRVDEQVNAFKGLTLQKPAPKPTSQGAVDLGLTPEDLAEILNESLRLLENTLEALKDLNEETANARLEEVTRDMGCVNGQLQIIGYMDLAVTATKLAQLAGKMRQNSSYANKHLMGLVLRLLEAMTAAVKAVLSGHPESYGTTLHQLMDELLVVEDGGDLSDSGQTMIGETLVRLGLISEQDLQRALSRQTRVPLGEILTDMHLLQPGQLEVALGVQEAQKERVTHEAAQAKAQNVRVDLSKLDLLGNLVGELVIAENMVTHHEQVQGEAFDSFKKSAQVLNRISREIQDLVMSLRMVPIHATFQKLSRLVRDISHKLDKKVHVELSGADTEIDKNVVENLSSPLMHIVRNALDHGMEPPDVREAAGKSAVGNLHLSAAQEGGEIVIIIEDDGRGIDPARVLAKAREKHLVDRDYVPENEQAVYELLMLPGFSTADQVTDLSGRGVGMDVVKRNIETMHGTIKVASTPGRGTRFTLRIPLTLSIIEGMLVRVGDTILTLPLLCIRESLVLNNHVVATTADGAAHIKIRNELLPVISLAEAYGLAGSTADLETGILVVVEYQGRSCCLLVDDILGQRQTVIKRVSSYFGDLSGVSGFSILSDGDITLVIDISRLV